MKKLLTCLFIFLLIFIFVFTGCSIKTASTVTEKTEASPEEISTDKPESEIDSSTVPETENEVSSESINVTESVVEILPITPDEVKELIDKGEDDYFLIDVRTPEEFSQGYIETANLIPISEIEDRLDEIPTDKKIIVYCRSGNRSRTAAQILIDNGFKEVYDLGGVIDWQSSGYELILPEN